MLSLDLHHVRTLNLSAEREGPWFSAPLVSVSEASLLVALPSGMEASTLPERVHVEFPYRKFWCRCYLGIKNTFEEWILLERPDEAECTFYQRRAFERIDLETEMLALPIGANGQQIGSPTPVRIKNLSAGGCLVTGDASLGQEGSHLMLVLSLPGLPTTTTASEVMRVSEGLDGKRSYGVRFKDLTFLHQQRVSEFVGREIRNAIENGHSIVSA